MTNEELIAAIRADRRVGRGTCSTIDECYDDAELIATFAHHGTVRGALRAAYDLEGLFIDKMLDARWGEDSDVELKIAAEWRTSARKPLSQDQRDKKAARARARRAARRLGV